MGVDDFGQRRLVGLGADIGVGGPDELVARYPMAGGCHAAEAKVGSVCQNRGEQRVVVFALLTRAQIGEGRREGVAKTKINLLLSR